MPCWRRVALRNDALQHPHCVDSTPMVGRGGLRDLTF